ncbi:TPA: FmdB family transcriptional regulator [bacterium]|nr:MAG: hypothetical protein AUJ18_08740 [Candidatus Hydrogenedentes bacterium CG1_02_42_14]HBW47597.1 FmdB family transcriptional regulator [bacterium]
MPIYEYLCRKGHHFEKMQSFVAKPVSVCPKCGEKAERKISLSAFHLKGSGWFSKDSAKSAKSEKKASSAKSSVTNKSKPKTENKSATIA